MVLKRGKQEYIGGFIVKFVPNKKSFHRWSLVVSRKFSKSAVKRNKKRRQIYESIRNYTKDKEAKSAPEYHDIVLIPKKTLIDYDYRTIYNNIADIVEKLESK